jgi:hypothetical protein
MRLLGKVISSPFLNVFVPVVEKRERKAAEAKPAARERPERIPGRFIFLIQMRLFHFEIKNVQPVRLAVSVLALKRGGNERFWRT